MKNILKNIIFLITAILFFSCSDEFINEKLDISGVAASAIIISPEWETDDYQFQCEGAGNADFVIESKPEWLNLETNSGKFINSIATIRGKANIDSRFSSPGIYIDQLVIKSGVKKFAVPVYYINEGKPVIQVHNQIEITYYNDGNSQLKISNVGEGILLWRIVSMPDWLELSTYHFDPSSEILGKGSTASLVFFYDPDKAVQSNMKGTILLASNDKNHPLTEISVTAEFGTPQLNLYYFSSPVVFNTNTNSQPFTISNIGNGILAWRIEELPEWLSFSKLVGTIKSYNNEDIILTCDYSKLKPGLNIATILIKTNDVENPSYPITIKARIPGNSESTRQIEGSLVDVISNKNANTLYYITSQPNKLVVFNVQGRKIEREIILTEEPTCLTISEDFTKAAIGHVGMVSSIDMKSFTVSETFEFDYPIFDIEWAKEDWFCFTQNTLNTNAITNIFWLNTKSKEVFETTSADNWLGTGNLKKVPGKPYIIGSRRGVSSSGIFVFDIDTKTRKSFVHSSIDNVWFIDEGNLIIDSYSNIIETYALTSATGNDLNPPISAGELKTGQFKIPAWWIDHSKVNHSIWAIFSNAPYNYSPPEPATIYQFEDNDYKLINTYYYDNFYQPDGQTTPYEVEARYFFANNDGTELTVLRKGKDNNNWSIEFIPVQ